MNFYTCLIIAAGGAIGTISRYGIAVWAAPFSKELPLGTIFINILGSFIIGFVGSLSLEQGRLPMSENARLFIMVGICGGFTTFSAFSLQTFDLLRDGEVSKALINIVLSVVLCILAVAAGNALAGRS
jgi:CrcB protein